MGKLNFYLLWSLRDAPRQFISKSNRRCFQVHIPLPLPKQLLIFGFGEWLGKDAALSAEVVVGVQTQNIGTLSPQIKCLTWEGEWSDDIIAEAAERGRRGVYGKILLRVCGEDDLSVLSSTPMAQRKCLMSGHHSTTELSSTLPEIAENETIISETSHVSNSVCYSEIQVNQVDTSEPRHPAAWPTDKTPRRKVTSQRACLTWCSEDMNSLIEDTDKASTPKKRKLFRMHIPEEITAQIKNESREVSARPSKRWSHAMCLSDPDTAVLIGGETSDQNYCKDSLWKFELDNDFWFPMNSSSSGPMPPCARGHTATFDPESKSVFVYGGLRDGQRYSELYILNTVTWKWRLVTAKGDVPNLLYHSAVFYQKELYVFGGVQPSHSLRDKFCSNSLYIFSPEYELWYQPIVEGDKPLPRFGHSATLLEKKLFIFGGQKTVAYLNDIHILDLGLMEYTAVKNVNMAPLPRGFHAAVPVSDNRILISGGCSAIGALQDVHVFNTDTCMWSSVACPMLCTKPRAGHSMIHLQTERDENRNIKCTVVVFGGSDCSGSFYDDTIKCPVEITRDK
ncbi:rab9 effector protein with kelch motifs [Cyprinodon tularosa]|uniref:rab9 effector protein with kelch motifs n=1 Tax=Cyprinodon tularosa TaxID=77115 RepID=UPI0018E2557E|nr:rab9 effector protein with kelch motifs [Cyprinodon tularosa]